MSAHDTHDSQIYDPSGPTQARDLLHLSAIQAWQALANGQPAPDLDPDLEQAIYEAFATGEGHQVDQLCESWMELAHQCGIAVDDEDVTCCPMCSTPLAVPCRRRSGSA